MSYAVFAVTIPSTCFCDNIIGHPKFNKCPNDIDYQIEADYSGLIAPGLPNVAVAMGENIDGLAPREVVDQVLDAIHYLIKSVDLPASLTDLGINKEKTNIHQWAVEAHKEQRLLTRSPRVLSVEDIELIYQNAFE